MFPLQEQIDQMLPDLIRFYRDLHAHPELSMEETETAMKIGTLLKNGGIHVTENVGGHGVVATIGDGTHPVLLLRADIDALPLTEQSGLPYTSTTRVRSVQGQETGVMHACGHDIHTTVLAGTALLMKDRVKKGTVMFVFQPSEETVSGATAMLDDGLYTRFFYPDFAVSLHVDPVMPAGTISYRKGVSSSGAESLDIIIHGIGGHAAYPEKTRDPVLIAASLIMALQAIVSREISPQDFCVVTVGSVHGGSKHNLIPDRVNLEVNLRYYRKEVREKALCSISRIAGNIARASDLPDHLLPEISILDESVPPLVNDPDLTDRIRDILVQRFGTDNVFEGAPHSGSEDFGFFGQSQPPVPLCYFRLGSYNPEKAAIIPEAERPPLHSPFFAPDAEPTIKTGIIAFSSIITGLTEGK